MRELLNCARSGDPAAQYRAGSAYLTGKGCEQDLFNAVQWYQRAACAGHSGAQYDLARCLFLGLGTSKDVHKAIYWLKVSALNEQPDAQCLLGLFYMTGWHLDLNMNHGWHLLSAAANNDCEPARNIVALLSAMNFPKSSIGESTRELLKIRIGEQMRKAEEPGSLVEA